MKMFHSNLTAPIRFGKTISDSLILRRQISDIVKRVEKRKTNSRPSLDSLRHLLQQNTELVYGLHPVSLALEAKRRKCYQLFIKEDLVDRFDVKNIMTLCEESGLHYTLVKGEQLNELCGPGRPHQGMCLEASQLPSLNYDPAISTCGSFDSWMQLNLPNQKQVSSDVPAVWVYLDQIFDPRNLGAIIRTCYYLGISNIMKSVHHSSSVTTVTSKASSGIAEITPVMSIAKPANVLKELKDHNFHIVAGTSSSHEDVIPLQDFVPLKKTLIVLGNEGDGISSAVYNLADTFVTIPHHEDRINAGSLNVSVAASIIMYHTLSKLNTI